MPETPKVSYWINNSIPIYDIRHGQDFWWWGVNCRNLRQTEEECEKTLELYGKISHHDRDEFWMGYLNGR